MYNHFVLIAFQLSTVLSARKVCNVFSHECRVCGFESKECSILGAGPVCTGGGGVRHMDGMYE
jgi:hypothetical protein